MDQAQGQATHKRPVAVFDYDGTCMAGQSGKLLATWMLRHGYLSPRATIGLAWWGARYKLHLPHSQEYPREVIFHTFMRLEPHQVEDLMVRFHQEVLAPRLRPQAVQEVRRRKEEGCSAVLVSATFDTIAREAARSLGMDGYVATRMECDETGHYTGKVLGGVIAGATKVQAARDWANESVGEGCWLLEYAYGDHHSDTELLSAAEHPFAVCPGPTLRRIAARRGWPILDWSR